MELRHDVQRFIDDWKMGRLTRRDVHRAFASVGLATVLTPIGRRAARAGDDDPTMYTWSGYEAPEMWSEYKDKYGSEPNFSFYGDEEEAFAKMRAGFKPDMGMPCSYKVKLWKDAGLLKGIDTDRLSHWPDVIDVLKSSVPDQVIDGTRYEVPAWWGLTSVTFRTDLAPEYVPEDKHTWGILWDEKYKGRLSMIDSLIDGVMAVGIYSGAKDPFNMTKDEVAKVKDLMVKQRPLLRFYTNDATSWNQALASGELIAADSWNDTPLFLHNQGIPAAYMNPKEGPMTWVCGIVMMASVSKEMEDRAYDLMNAYLAPSTGQYWIEQFGMGHSNNKAYSMISAEDLKARGLPPDDIPGYIASGHFQKRIENEPELEAMYEEVKAGM